MADNLIDIAKSMVPLIQSSLDRIDSERQLPSELASAMAKKQLFGLYVPKELGGPETDPITAFRVVEEIAHDRGGFRYNLIP
jgi:alkylation response protein AidB-like acyl-CoA dehydrogenase